MRLPFAVLAAAAFAVSGAAAYAETVVVHDGSLDDDMAVKRAIVDVVQKTYGETAVYDTSDDLPDGIEQALTPGRMLPEGAELEPVPEDLAGRLPTSEPRAEWAKLGEHLVETRPTGEIIMVVYDVLP